MKDGLPHTCKPGICWGMWRSHRYAETNPHSPIAIEFCERKTRHLGPCGPKELDERDEIRWPTKSR